VGKRRMAREMAMQMLFQAELGGTPLPLVVGSFDPVEYLNQLQREIGEPEEDVPDSPEKAAPAPKPAAMAPGGAKKGTSAARAAGT
jgi:hypothetical protein